jgi:transglutaminase-like putative cysteine protease
MRFRVRREWTCRFEPAAKTLIGQLRATPRDHDGQVVGDWNVELSADCGLRVWEDAFGNLSHSFEAQGDLARLTVVATGEVQLDETAGFVRGAPERFPAELYLRESQLAVADAALRGFAEKAVEGAEGALARMHALMGALHEAIEFDPSESPRVGATQAFNARKGCGRDFAHMFVAAARHLGEPARYVDGLAADVPGAEHAWAEAYIEGYGWIAFDPALDLCPSGRHLRVAMSLDALGAEPLRVLRQSGAAYGGDVVEPIAVLEQQSDPRAAGQ